MQGAQGTATGFDTTWKEMVFSVPDARRALPYVARVTEDATNAFREAQRCRFTLQRAVGSERRAQLSLQRDEAVERLNAAIDEFNALGVDVLDLRHGVVRLRAIVDGCSVSLIWRLGEPVADAWETLVVRPAST